MKTRWKIVLAVIALLAVVGGSAAVFARRNRTTEDDIEIATVKRGDLHVEVVETGTVEPTSKVDVKSKVSGRVLEVFVEEGDAVAAGQAIARLDIPGLLSRRDQIRAQLRQADEGLTEAELAVQIEARRVVEQLIQAREGVNVARAALQQLEAGPRPEEVRQAEARLERANAQRAEAHRNLDRQRELYDQGFVPRDAVDRAQTQLDVAEADVKSAEEGLALLRAGPRAEEIEQARARLRQAEAELAMAETGELQLQQARSRLRRAAGNVDQLRSALAEIDTQVADAEIVAPTAGVVIARQVEPGSMVIAATGGFSEGTTLVTVGDLSAMQVNVELNEVDVAKIQEGSSAEVTADALRGQTFSGWVTKISPAASQRSAQAGTLVVKFRVEVTLDAPDADLRPGMSAKVTITGETHDDTLYLPRDAVVKRENGEYVKFVEDEDALREARKQRGKRSKQDKDKDDDEKSPNPNAAYEPKTFEWGREVKVVTGLVTPLFVEILEGLAEGDTVLVEPEHSERKGFGF